MRCLGGLCLVNDGEYRRQHSLCAPSRAAEPAWSPALLTWRNPRGNIRYQGHHAPISFLDTKNRDIMHLKTQALVSAGSTRYDQLNKSTAQIRGAKIAGTNAQCPVFLGHGPCKGGERGGGGGLARPKGPTALRWRRGIGRTTAPRVTFRRVVAPLRGPGRSPVLPFACCVGSLRSVSRCGRCSCWCRFRVRGAQSLVCWGCAECGMVCRLRLSGAQQLAY